MSSQQQLTAFDEQPDTTEPSDDNPQPETPTEAEIDTSGTAFSSPDQFPRNQIETLASGTISLTLCVEQGTVSPDFETIAGNGGMGTAGPIGNPAAVADVATACIGLPVLLTGGGMNTPMGSGVVVGRLQEVSHEGDQISIELRELYRQQGVARQETRSARLGAYKLSVPASATDCQAAIDALSAWNAGDIGYLDPAERRQQELVADRVATFEDLSPADKLETPAYSSRLEVVSEPFETHAVIPRGTLSNRTIEVLSVIVNNPNGGYYQLGLETSPTGRNSSVPSCYLSSSSSTPPTPNTAFTRDEKFSSTELEVTPIDHPPDPEVVAPNKDILESPLPEPRLRTSMDDLDGIGEKTAMKLHRATDERVSAESIAYTMFGDGDIHTSTLREVEQILKSLPQTESIFDQLEGYVPEP